MVAKYEIDINFRSNLFTIGGLPIYDILYSEGERRLAYLFTNYAWTKEYNEISSIQDKWCAETTVIDIYSSKSSLDRSYAKTGYQIAQALGRTMEEFMMLDTPTDNNTKLVYISTNHIWNVDCRIFAGNNQQMKEVWQLMIAVQRICAGIAIIISCIAILILMKWAVLSIRIKHGIYVRHIFVWQEAQY